MFLCVCMSKSPPNNHKWKLCFYPVKEFQGYEFDLADPKSFTNAQDDCLKEGGHIASIRSAEENDFLTQHVYTGLLAPIPDVGQAIEMFLFFFFVVGNINCGNISWHLLFANQNVVSHVYLLAGPVRRRKIFGILLSDDGLACYSTVGVPVVKVLKELTALHSHVVTVGTGPTAQ